jgi:hypothetical protein
MNVQSPGLEKFTRAAWSGRTSLIKMSTRKAGFLFSSTIGELFQENTRMWKEMLLMIELMKTKKSTDQELLTQSQFCKSW